MSFSFSGALEGLGESWGLADQDPSGGGSGIPPDAEDPGYPRRPHRGPRPVGPDRRGQPTWSRFADDNGGLPEHTGVGTNYLDVCRRAGGRDADDAARSLDGLQAVLSGSQPEFRLEYPCHSPTERRWFLLQASPVSGSPGGAVTAHLTITERKLAEEVVRRSAAELSRSNDELRRLATQLEEMARSRERAHEEVEAAYRQLKAAQSQLVQAEKLSSLGQLVAGIAHEINNPLAFVTNNINLLQRELPGPDRTREALPGLR